MELQIAAQNMELSPAVRRYIEQKLGRLNRHLPNIIVARVEIIEEKTKSPQQRYVVQITLESSGTLLRGEGRGGDLFTAIDKVAEVMDRQIEHQRFAVKPMPVAEAIEQMELLRHDFFLFLNADTEEINLLYRRKDNNYGLIEPELG